MFNNIFLNLLPNFLCCIIVVEIFGVLPSESNNDVILPSIPIHLQECYRTGGPFLGAPRRLDVFLSLLRKLELNTTLDARMISTSLLRGLRLDGIEQAPNIIESEFILPYRASSFQFQKFRLLMNLLLPSQRILNVDETLSLEEKCLLHRMLSSTVQQWERGDENIVCPMSVEQRQGMAVDGNTRARSRCPIEDGIIQTNWGTVSPGTLLSAIAASLESQSVSMIDILNTDVIQDSVPESMLQPAISEWLTDTKSDSAKNQRQSDANIDNIWAATLAGDLAEVILNQGPQVGAESRRMTIGSNNRWNDTLLPRNYYLLTQNASVTDWYFTDSEVLAGIDGLILARYVPAWLEERRTLRLSQVIDMYYSNEGAAFKQNVKACNRAALFNEIFSSVTLLKQASLFAHLLSLNTITVYIPYEEIEQFSQAAVYAFERYLPVILSRNHVDCTEDPSVPPMDLVVATDSSWKAYDVQRFLSWLGGALEVNLQRSTIALMHGNTGQWIAPPSDNLTTLFSHISNFTDQYPNRLDLTSVISTTIQYSLNKTLEEKEKGASAGLSTVVLIVSPTDRPSTDEVERARQRMNTLRASFFDVFFTYAARDLTEFQNINADYLDYSELFLQTASSSVQDVIKAVETYLVQSDIPTKIIGAPCPINGTVLNQVEFEDFVLPKREKLYRIHPYYLKQQPEIKMQIRNSGQGSLSVCSWRGAEESHQCHFLAERNYVLLNWTDPCPSPEFCPPAHLSVTATNSTNTCANNECRFPQEVSYYMQHSGLKCLKLRSSAPNIFYSRIFMYFFCISCLNILYSIINFK